MGQRLDHISLFRGKGGQRQGSAIDGTHHASHNDNEFQEIGNQLTFNTSSNA
jgi:hypothetical protein